VHPMDPVHAVDPMHTMDTVNPVHAMHPVNTEYRHPILPSQLAQPAPETGIGKADISRPERV
jgi:hypothetical protein